MTTQLPDEMTPEEAKRLVDYEFSCLGDRYKGTCTLAALGDHLMAPYLAHNGPEESWLEIKRSLKVRTVTPNIDTSPN